MNYQWFDFVGNVGVFLILVSYFLLQIEKIESKSVSYSLANAIGAVLIIISLCFDFNLSSFTIEVFWLLISLYGLVHIMRTNRAQ